ncbi:MAG: hypothetical protein Q9162_001710 [Coniocarpon cinnabarinum]
MYSPVSEDDSEKTLRESQTLDELLSLQRSQRSLKQTVWILSTILALCFFALLAGLARPPSKALEYPQLLRTPVPPIPMEVRNFERDPLYADRPNPDSDAAWNHLLPNGRGFVFIQDWEDYNLEPGEETAWSPIYSVALFHQLHCLGVIRKTYWKMIDHYHANDTEFMDELVENLLGPEGEHAHHCFDYLRQTIQCAGDMAMEWPRVEPDTGLRFAVDGWHIPHECKSWDHIVDYMDKNHFNASMNSDIAPDHPHHHKEDGQDGRR